MEEVIDFDKWASEYTLPAITYVATYDPATGAVKSVGPSHAFENEKYKIDIDNETAESIINTEIKIHHCFVNVESNTMEIAEIKNVFKIDDVLHRIISKDFFTEKNIDVYLLYNSKNKTLKIQLSAELGGTKKSKLSIKKRGIVWDGETEMKFLVTDYNDPNLIFEMFSVKISDLIGKTKIINNVNYDKFSVYTRRLFKNYVIEYK
jgi:hypothetical protein